MVYFPPYSFIEIGQPAVSCHLLSIGAFCVASKLFPSLRLRYSLFIFTYLCVFPQPRSEIRTVRSADREPTVLGHSGEVDAEPGGGADGGAAKAARPRPHDRSEGRHLQLRPARQQTRE